MPPRYINTGMLSVEWWLKKNYLMEEFNRRQASRADIALG
jgi:hypothetical protein